MDSFKLLKRRTTDLFQSLPQSLPAMPSMPSLGISNGKSHGSSIKGTWEKISVPPLPRSSHSVNIVAGNVYVFGGEVEPRKPVDNDMHVVTLPSSGAQADYYAIKAKAASTQQPARDSSTTLSDEATEVGDKTTTTPLDKGKGLDTSGPELGDVPSPRIGHATAVIGQRIFLFGGRGGPDMEPLNEAGRVWVFDARGHQWTFLDPVFPGSTTSFVPDPRSDHSAVATDKPENFAPHPSPHHHHIPSPTSASVGSQIRQFTNPDSWRDWAKGDSDSVGIPQRPIVGSVAEHATDADADGYGTLIIHGGRLANNARTSDVWAFDIRSRIWQRLPDAPDTPRSGVALALTRSRLYRFGGFNGSSEEGAQLDYLELVTESFHDAFAPGEQEVSISARTKDGWQSLMQGKENVGYKEVDPAAKPLTHEEDEWPGPRSVAALEAITVGGGREYLVLMLGQRDADAGKKFWDDVWAFQVPSVHMSAASLTDSVLSAVGRRSSEGRWTKVSTGAYDDEDDASAAGPGPRGWASSGTMGDLEENGIVVWGGLGDGGKRLGDGWIFRLG